MNRISLISNVVTLALAFCVAQNQVMAQVATDDDGLASNVDHVVTTLTSTQFKAINEYLSQKFPLSWMCQGDSKGFMLCSSQRAYAEFWNSGIWYQYGYQVAFSSPETDDAPTRASKRFNTSGVHWSEALFTAGSNGAVGHPVAGTFLVHPGGMRSLKKENGRIADFVELITAIPEARLGEKSNYLWFGMKLTDNDKGFTAADPHGFKMTAIEVSDKSVMNFGHIALGFRLADPVDTPEEHIIPKSGGLKVIFEGDKFWLVLKPDLFTELRTHDK